MYIYIYRKPAERILKEPSKLFPTFDFWKYAAHFSYIYGFYSTFNCSFVIFALFRVDIVFILFSNAHS